jgi:hypothetical protein
MFHGGNIQPKNYIAIIIVVDSFARCCVLLAEEWSNAGEIPFSIL